MTTDSIIPKVYSFCHTLRVDGMGYGDCLIIENIEAGLASFRAVATALQT